MKATKVPHLRLVQSSPRITWDKWLTLRASTLARLLKISSSEVSQLRYTAIGHARPILLRYAKGVGMWGGLLTLREISELLSIPTKVLQNYTTSWNLRSAVSARGVETRYQADLAIRAWAVWEEYAGGREIKGSIRDISSILGVYPVEAMYYIRAVQYLSKVTETTPQQLHKLNSADLNELWEEYKLTLFFPELHHDEEERQRIRSIL